jgi:hypothetical protein
VHMQAGKRETKLPPEARDALMRAWLAILRERHPSVLWIPVEPDRTESGDEAGRRD